MQDEKNVNGKQESIVVVVCLRVVKNNKLLHFARYQSEIVKGLERKMSGPQMATGAECFSLHTFRHYHIGNGNRTPKQGPSFSRREAKTS